MYVYIHCMYTCITKVNKGNKCIKEIQINKTSLNMFSTYMSYSLGKIPISSIRTKENQNLWTHGNLCVSQTDMDEVRERDCPQWENFCWKLTVWPRLSLLGWTWASLLHCWKASTLIKGDLRIGKVDSSFPLYLQECHHDWIYLGIFRNRTAAEFITDNFTACV